MNNKYKTLFSNTIVFAISNVISKVILSLLLPLYTRTMSTSEYGTVELITTISQLLYPALSLSIQDSAFRFAMDKNMKAEQVLKNSMIVVLAGCIVFFPVSFAMKGYRGIDEYWIYFYLFSILSMVRSMLSLYVKGIKKTVTFSIDIVLYNGLLAIMNFVFLAGLQMRIDGYFFSIVIASIASICFLLLNSNISKAVKEIINKQLLKEMLKYSAPLILNSISWGLTHVVDRVMLTGIMGSDANGIYSAASKIPSLLSLVTTMFTQAWTISLIQDYETERDKKFYNLVFKFTHVGCLFCALIILLFNNNLFLWILGKSFAESVSYVPILLIGTLFLTYSNFFSSFFSATKKSTLNMLTSVLGCIFNVVFNFLLIPRLGIVGACIATAGSYVVISITRIIFSQKVYPIDMDLIRFCISLFVLLICDVCVAIDKYAVFICIVALIIEFAIYHSFINSIFQRVKFKLRKRKSKQYR